MRIVSANLLCLNPRPLRAMEAVAAQRGDVTILIEATRRFDRYADALLPERRGLALPRHDGMPVAIHAREGLVDLVEEGRHGWIEAQVGRLRLFGVHMVAPYLPWRISRRYRQLMGLSERLCGVCEGEPGLAIGDFNTADFERAWRQLESRIQPWRRLEHEDAALRGTWGLGQVWSPFSVDHALACPEIATRIGRNGSASIRTFIIPGSDHLGLVIDLPDVEVGLRGAGPGDVPGTENEQDLGNGRRPGVMG